jgi:hypothetical protein
VASRARRTAGAYAPAPGREDAVTKLLATIALGAASLALVAQRAERHRRQLSSPR